MQVAGAFEFRFNDPFSMQMGRPHERHLGKVNTNTLLQDDVCTSSFDAQDDLVQVIANTLLSRLQALTRPKVNVCFEAANALVRYTSSHMNRDCKPSCW